MKQMVFKSIMIAIAVLMIGCGDASDSSSTTSSEDTSSTETVSDTTTETTSETTVELADWTEATHSNDVEPNYTEVFDDTQVKRLDLVVTSERWQSMLDDMTELYGEFNSNSTGNQTPGREVISTNAVTTLALADDEIPVDAPVQGEIPVDGEIPADAPVDGEIPTVVDGEIPTDAPVRGEIPVDGEIPADAPAIGEIPTNLVDNTEDLVVDEDPIFVESDIYYNGIQWYNVGLRFKGNSSLQSAWQSGILKLSFKLDFDEYEDDYPEIDNQRFYGFKKFSLKNNYDDSSFLREKVASDVFRSAGVAVSHTAFYEVYVDHGNGPEYFGLYTLVEEVDGEVLDTQFSSDDGNLYKPEDGSANFVEGTFNQDDFEKKTNEDDEDWSDIQSLFTALHATTRTTDPSTWRDNLEAVFDVDTFLKYLAVNGVIQNWDTYGLMIHNYYLYNNPENGLLTWIPWDHNEAFQDGKLGGALALDFSNLEASNWPLIEKIYADEEYKATYDAYVQDTIDNAFNSDTIQAKYDTYAAIVESSATSEVDGYTFLTNETSFTQAIETLKEHAQTRKTAAIDYLQ